MADVRETTVEELIAARRLLRAVETHNRRYKRSNAAVRGLWESWDHEFDSVMRASGEELRRVKRALGVTT